MKNKQTSIGDQLRAALNDCGQTRYRVSKETGISPATLCRFVSGQRGLPLKTLERLCDFLGLELVAKRRSKKGR